MAGLSWFVEVREVFEDNAGTQAECRLGRANKAIKNQHYQDGFAKGALREIAIRGEIYLPSVLRVMKRFGQRYKYLG